MPNHSAPSLLLALLLSISTLACADETPGPAEGADADPDRTEAASTVAETAAPPTLDEVGEIGVRNAAMPIPGVLTGGQPDEQQFEALSRAGFRRFISLRPVGEEGAGWEEADAAEHGHAFERLPIEGAGSLTRANVERFARLMDGAEGDGTVLYCASGNRVGAMLALEAYWVDGASADSALALGLRGGMTRLEGPVRELLGMEPAGTS